MLPLLIAASLSLLGGHANAEAARTSASQAIGTWAFEPPRDDFRAGALLDLRYLNEKVAGESGYVKVDHQGDFVLANGKPVRFWAVNTNVGREKPWTPKPRGPKLEPDLANHARFLAKHGVNMIRLHAQLSPPPEQPITNFDAHERDWIWRTVAAMKKEGIYSTISPYWSVAAKIGKNWEVPGGEQSALGLLFFDHRLQEGYRAWLKALMSETNPYTGVSLAKDPSVAIIEIQNEDSLLFWTVNAIQGEQRKNLQRLYAAWLEKKYGSLATAKERWQGDALPGDNSVQGLMDFHNVWELTQQRQGGRQARLADQLEFLTETMRTFNANIVRYLKEDLGYKGLVNAGNWRTADSARLFDAERYSYTPTDVDAVNRYFTGAHEGKNNGWAIENGDRYTSPSALLQPNLLPINCKQTIGRPMLVTESSWVMPAAYASEAPFLISAYQSVSGVDAYYWFATGDDQWTPPQSANGYSASQQKWLYGNPDMLGGFPAAALMYRQAYVKRAQPAVIETRSPEDLWQHGVPAIWEEAGFDPNRDFVKPTNNSDAGAKIDPLAFLVGPVCVDFAKTSNLNVVSFENLINRNDGFVRSATKEVTLNWKQGFCTVDSPCAQGVSAFFNRKSAFRLTDLAITSENSYGTVLAVSLDGMPLASSHRVLVQAGTQCRPTGWSEKPATITVNGSPPVDAREIVSTGEAPWQVTKAKFRIDLSNSSIRTATSLDPNGYASGTVSLTRGPKGISCSFPESAIYVVLRS